MKRILIAKCQVVSFTHVIQLQTHRHFRISFKISTSIVSVQLRYSLWKELKFLICISFRRWCWCENEKKKNVRHNKYYWHTLKVKKKRNKSNNKKLFETHIIFLFVFFTKKKNENDFKQNSAHMLPKAFCTNFKMSQVVAISSIF